MIVGQIEEVRIDEPAHELYCSDSYLGGRVMVFDLDTFAFKRGWGAYGHKLSEMTTDPADRDYTPGGPEPKEFQGHLTLNILQRRAGLCRRPRRESHHRHQERWHVREGNRRGPQYRRRFRRGRDVLAGQGAAVPVSSPISITTTSGSSTAWMARLLGQLGSMGQNGGQFFGLHMIATDSKGNLYTGEVFNGERVQRFVPVK